MHLTELLRSLRREPAAVAAAAAILAFVSGAAITVFALVDATLLEPPPYREPDRLVQIEATRGGSTTNISMKELDDLRERTDVFQDIAAYKPPSGGYTMSDGDGPPHEAPAVLVTHNIFSVLGVDLEGSSFPASYDLERSFGIVLSSRIFQDRFGNDEDVFDEVLTLDGAPNYTVFGVTPRGFDFPFHTDLYRSIYINERNPNLEDRSVRVARGVARLVDGVSFEAAQSRVAAVSEALVREFPDSNTGVSLHITPIDRALIGNVRPYLVILAGAAALLLLIGAVNASNLLLTRALVREREFAVRAAMGASRARLAARALTESVLVALLGVVLGIGIGALGEKAIARLVRFELPSWVQVQMDASVIPVALAGALALGLVVGLVSALRLSRVDPEECLRADRGGSVSRGQQRIVRGLLMAQVGLALILLAAAGTLLDGFRRLAEDDFGFDHEGVLSMKVNLPWFLYSRSRPETTQLFHDRVLEGLAAIPAARSVAMTSDLPFTSGAEGRDIEIQVEGQSADEIANNPLVRPNIISTGYFETMEIPLLEGRVFQSTDHADAPAVAIVNRSVAQRLWPEERPIGKRLRANVEEAEWIEIVGVVDDVRRVALDSEWRDGLQIYRPRLQSPAMNVHYVVRVAGTEPATILPDAERAVWAADPAQPVWDVESMALRLDQQLWREHTVTWLAGAFALTALLLAALGLYAALAESVRRRRREIGLRMAVGASASDIGRLVLREGGTVLLGGSVIGLIGLILLVPRAASASVFLEAPTPTHMLSAVSLLAILGLVFAIPPAWRAIRLDPTINLRAE